MSEATPTKKYKEIVKVMEKIPPIPAYLPAYKDREAEAPVFIVTDRNSNPKPDFSCYA